MQYPIRAVTSPIHAKVIIPGSKDITYRALLLSALADGVSEITGVEISEDTRTLISALYQLGIAIQLDEKLQSCIIAGGNGKFPKKQATVWCKDTDIVARFLLAACSASQGSYYFDGLPSLREQSISPLLDVITRQGVQCIPNDARKLPLTLIGPDSLLGGEIMLDHAIANQLVPPLLMIAPFARSPFNFTVHDSINYPPIDMTCAMMAEFGVLVHRMHQGQFMVPVPQRYQAKDYVVEPDLSIAAYFFAAAAATGGEVTIQATKRSHSKQTDIKFLSVLENIGCQTFETHAGLTVKGPAELQGIEVNMQDLPDIFPALAALAAFAKSSIRISHIAKSNRILALKSELIKLDIHVETGENWIHIFPSQARGALVSSHQDPRIAMALAIIGLKVPGVIIDDAECITSIYPEFFTYWNKLSNQMNVSA